MIDGSDCKMTRAWCRSASFAQGETNRVALMLLGLSNRDDMGVIVFGEAEAREFNLKSYAIARGLQSLQWMGLVEVVARRGRRGIVKILAVKEVI